jgi:hypothetical protein
LVNFVTGSFTARSIMKPAGQGKFAAIRAIAAGFPPLANRAASVTVEHARGQQTKKLHSRMKRARKETK